MKYFYGLQGWLCRTKFNREVLKEHTTKAMEQMILDAGMGMENRNRILYVPI